VNNFNQRVSGSLTKHKMTKKVKKFLVQKMFDDMKKAGFSKEKIDAEIDKWDYSNRHQKKHNPVSPE